MDSQESLLSIFIDFTKAFDTVSHEILLRKLHYYGIRGPINNWFRDYLSNRTQSVKLYNHISPPQTINYGVPQGSVLGPILFNIYINDISLIFNKFKTILFADDTTLYITGKNPLDMINTANADLQNLHNWCLCNKMTINLNKSFYMLFTNKVLDNLPPLLYNNSIIQKTDKHTLLGITFDDKLTLKTHIANILLKLTRVMSLIYRVKDYVSTSILKILYNAHVLPHLHYCTPIWCSTYPTHLLPLFRIQKRLFRIVSNSDFYEHTQPLFKDLHTLKIFDINKMEIAVYMFKIINNRNAIDLQLPNHNYPTRTQQHIRIPMHNLTIFQHSLSYLGPKTWNLLPDHIKFLRSLYSFKKHIKKHLLNQY